MSFVLGLVGLLAVGSGAGPEAQAWRVAAASVRVPYQNPNAMAPQWGRIRESLLAMAKADQEARNAALREADPERAMALKVAPLDRKHTEAMKALLAQVGWPMRSAVGEEAANAAFLLVQHSPDTAFQAEALLMLEAAAKAGEAERQGWALLSDRVRLAQGLSQRFGSQYQVQNGQLRLQPCEDLAKLDERRASVGLGPQSEYEAVMQRTYRLPVGAPMPPLPSASPTPAPRAWGF